MSRLAELLKSKSLAANVASPANLRKSQGQHSQPSQHSQGVDARLHLSPNLDQLIDTLHEPGLPPALGQRIKRMAIRWRYDLDETREVLALAAVDPYAWTLAVLLDERREAEFRECGLLQ